MITDGELRIAKQGAMSAARSGRGIVDPGDLVSEAHLWIVEHMDKVIAWREQGRHGQNKLRHACRQRCLTIIARERRNRSGLEPGDVFYYTPALLREILPNIWDPDDWASGQATVTQERQGPSRPAEGNNRLAMIVDVRAAYHSLAAREKNLLADLYRDGGLSHEVVAIAHECTERTVRRREERALDKLVERLGGEAPWAQYRG